MIEKYLNKFKLNQIKWMKLNILHNKLVLDYKLYILLHIENKTGCLTWNLTNMASDRIVQRDGSPVGDLCFRTHSVSTTAKLSLSVRRLDRGDDGKDRDR